MKKSPEIAEAIIAQTPIGRIATPHEIAEGVLWLCSDASSFMQGSPLVLDGGYMS
jgi:NAD(P)-dependent dehydrogenase (short-subunit alcohol dehydrogenase family)